MPRPNVSSIIESLQSGKVRERQEGIQELNRLLSSRSNLGDSPHLPKLLDALIYVVRVEKGNLRKGSAQTAGKRAEEAARAVRHLVENVSTSLDKREVANLCNGLRAQLISDRVPCPHIALDFLKALKHVLSYRPHLNQFNKDGWVEIVSLCFNVILENSLGNNLFNSEDADESTGQSSDEEDDELPVVPENKKRRRPNDHGGGTPLKRARMQMSVSSEQVECASILAELLQSTTFPITSQKFKDLPSALLRSLQEFGEKYPTESSLLYDYLKSVTSILEHLAYNEVQEVRRFAQSTRRIFTNLLGLKDRRLKEQLLIILRLLLPFVAPMECDIIQSQPTGRGNFEVVDAMNELWKALDNESKAKWGPNELDLDSLRLELLDPSIPSSSDVGDNPFVATTFRAGWNFSSSQALSWAMIELQADCGKHLYHLNERAMETPRMKSVRSAPVNPLNVFTAQNGPLRLQNLQVLLFFIDRHWSELHESAKQAVIKHLSESIGKESVSEIVQSWLFLNLAAIALAEKSCVDRNPDARSLQTTDALDARVWDVVWGHAIRRVNTPGLCRAACHAAHALLVSLFRYTAPSGQIFLTSHVVLQEIENFAKGLDLQGPSYPFDSVCMFLRKCIQIASQDVRLYRLQLEDKVSNWFADTWSLPTRTNNVALPHTANDFLLLFGTISGLTKQVDLAYRTAVPMCPIVDSMKMELRLQGIREYALSAKLPAHPISMAVGSTKQPTSGSSGSRSEAQDDLRHEPRKRERKISTFLNKTVTSLLEDWRTRVSGNTQPNVEAARIFLDIAITAIAFEATLTMNSTASTKQLLLNSGHLLNEIVEFTFKSRYNREETLSLVLGLECLVSASIPVKESPWSGVTPPDFENDGMERPPAVKGGAVYDPLELLRRSRGELLRAIWQSHHLQRPLDTLLKTIRDRILPKGSNSDSQAMRVDDDGFEPIRIASSIPTSNSPATDASALQKLHEIYIPMLTRGPRFQSSEAMSTKDRALMECVAKAARTQQDWFLMVAPIVFEEIHSENLSCDPKQMSTLLVGIGNLSSTLEHTGCPNVTVLAIQLLHSTLNLWARSHPLCDLDETHSKIMVGLPSLVKLSVQELSAWKVRDAFVQFLEAYVSTDPSESLWRGDRTLRERPLSILKVMVRDRDVRVRYRAAIAMPRVMITSETSRKNLEQAYVGDPDDVNGRGVRDSLPLEGGRYEYTMTRLLTLANIAIISSEIRRGAYWNFIETYLMESKYLQHMQAALKAVVEALGLPDLSSLFECYGQQLAYSMTMNNWNLSAFKPELFGYPSKRNLYEAAWQPFVPIYVILGAEPTLKAHCEVVQKTPDLAMQEFIGEIIGLCSVFLFDNEQDASDETVEKRIRVQLNSMEDSTDIFANTVAENVGSIAASILRTLKDQDISATGAIRQAIGDTKDVSIGTVFSALSTHRLGNMRTHAPNLPAFAAASVAKALAWVSKKLGRDATSETAMVYHVVHNLFANIQQTPLVNEKYRLFNSLCLWVALKNTAFADSTLLHTLLHGAASLLGQQDLALCAQSLLEWVFSVYRRTKVADARLAPVLVRVCGTCHEYATSDDSTLAVLGRKLSTWIDEEVFKMTKPLKDVVAMALAAWPRDPMNKLIDFSRGQNQSHYFEKFWTDKQINANKFRMVRRLNERLSSRAVFAQNTFWRLKECIPPTDQLQQADVLAFTDLLARNHGSIGSLNVEQSSAQSIRSMHRRAVLVRANEGYVAEGRNAIIWGLVQLLKDESPVLVETAYKTLRLMLAVHKASSQSGPLSQSSEKNWWKGEQRVEIELLESFPVTPLTRPAQSLDIILSEEWEEKSTKFSEWVKAFAGLLAGALASTDPCFGQLHPILSTDVATAEQILPVLVICLLNSTQNSNSRDVLTTYFTKVLKQDKASLSTTRCIVDAVLHLRYFAGHSGDLLSYNKWLGLNFLLLAKSAVRCGAYTTAVLFLELYSEHSTTSEDSDLDVAEQIQYEIYAHIDEPDGFYGIQTHNLHQFLVQRLHHERQYDKALRFHGAMLEAHSSDPRGEDVSGLLKSFHAFGFNHLAINALQQPKLSTETPVDSAINYKLGWRSETWDLPDRDSYGSGYLLYNTLRAVYRERDPRVIDTLLHHSLEKEIGQLRNLRVESIAEIREVNQSLMCLNQILQWRSAFVPSDNKLDLSRLNEFSAINSEFEFQDLDNVMSTRIALLRSVRQREERQRIGTVFSDLEESVLRLEKQCLISLSKAARKADQNQVALNCILRARSLEAASSVEVTTEYANVLWSMNEPKPAVTLLNSVMKQLSPSSRSLKATLLSQLGTWMSEACLEKPTVIWETCFMRANRAADPGQPEDAAKVYHLCAVFADKQYHAMKNSPDILRAQLYIDRKKKEIDMIKKYHPGDDRRLKAAQGLLEADEQQHTMLLDSKNDFLLQAIAMYSQSLSLSEAYDGDAPIKLSSLWYANFDDSIIGRAVIDAALARIPSRKFIFLSHQLAARIIDACPENERENQEALQKLVKRLCLEHPFHGLYQVFSLKADSAGRGRGQAHPAEESQMRRKKAADGILDKLGGETTQPFRARLTDVLRACDAYLRWCKYRIQAARDNQPMPIPDTEPILKLRDIKIPVLTLWTPIDPTMHYNNFVSIRSYEKTFTTAGGVNLPKICVCIGSDRQPHKQLFKGQGQDDMRQDAVMEQVFSLVNQVLEADRETARRSLNIRGYTVVPLGAQAGVIEFVTNTSPLRDWLTKMHPKYNPKDLRLDVASKMLKAAHEQKKTPEEKIAIYESVCAKLRPVFRHYFTEKHKNPMGWFAFRLCYTRSVAVTAIVGHILGLGDRHTSNILLNNTTGEMVHIDLGIAFDQGKLLPVPERVPFRLTRDIVDGMGTSGTQGVFQRCAEETLRVMRDGSDIIMTVLEVFKYDPLHSWTASEIKIQHAQPGPAGLRAKEPSRFQNGLSIDMDSGSAEEAADRALSSVARKLDKSLSVESTVNALIAEARDVQNLGVIWYGWGPHL